jgi:hypothetical protein
VVWILADKLLHVVVPLIAIIGWYPYPFSDVAVHGYAAVGATCLVIAALMVALATGALWLEHRLQRWEPTDFSAR